jgi:benzoyl-CoA-dihydrodiol lyase
VVVIYLKRLLKRLDVTSRSLFAIIDEGSCFSGSLFEIVLASDRSFHLLRDQGEQPLGPPVFVLDHMSFGPLPMCNGLTRLQTRFLDDEEALSEVRKSVGVPLDAAEASHLGLVTFTPDEIDWDDEIRMAIEERASFSPDALTGLEANYRFAGPETIETKIFGRLTAWQNWIFSRPNASGPEGALRRYGTGQRAPFDRKRA